MNARSASARRGQPIVALVAIILIWFAARTVMWDPVYEVKTAQSARPIAGKSRPPWPSPRDRLAPLDEPVPAETSRFARPPALLVDNSGGQMRLKPVITEIRPAGQEGDAATFRLASNYRIGPSAAATPPVKVDSSPPGKAPLKDDPRWTFDRWLLLRAGSGDAAQAPGAASYGASQAGAIARFRLGKGDVQESYGYLRTSLAINAPGKDKEIALGFGIRPARRLPLRVLAEARLFDSSRNAMQMRPVVTVITELPWQNLPAGFRAEAYGQAGYAGGKASTAFFDAQALVDRSVGKVIGVKRDVRIGAGLWAGGQQGAVRLDVGPRLSFPLDLGEEVPSRIALDWRLRVAGNARPPSGPALTIASSF